MENLQNQKSNEELVAIPVKIYVDYSRGCIIILILELRI